MIVKMKMISLVVLDREKSESLTELRRIGVVHLTNQNSRSDELSDLEEKKLLLDRSLLLMPAVKGEQRKREGSVKEALEIAQETANLIDEERLRTEELERLSKEESRLSVWGDFNPADIEYLRQKNVRLQFLDLSPENFAALPENLRYLTIEKTRYAVKIVVISLPGQSEADLQELPPARRGLGELHELIKEKNSSIVKLHEELQKLAENRSCIEESIKKIDHTIEFERARAGMGIEQSLAYLKGYVPVGKVEKLKSTAAEQGWALLIEEPGEDDQVPTLIKNPPWIRIIKPVFDFLGTVPGYREFDTSFWFLLAFSIFFAMLIGDAGYGIFFLVLTLLARIKMRKAPAAPFFLMLVLSFSTIVWGALTGTWFGSVYFAQSRFLSWMVIPSISSFGADPDFIMLICFVIGAVHLSIARIISFFKNLPKLKAFAELGWLTLVWGMFFLVRYYVLQKPLNYIGLWLLAGGLFLIVLFAEQKGSFLKGLAMGLANLPLKLLDSISAFSDIISYVRLFAVGLATVKVAESFNEMALDIGLGLPAGLAAALILFCGHLLNIAMGALSVIVHGVRLNMLEFSSHLGMEWTGVSYKPFNDDIG
jgi:V/A-type H+-transporting ATPase subunit I